MTCFSISGRQVGGDSPAFLIAELSANHGGSIERARKIIRLAYESGADAIKFQTYKASTITLDSDNEDFSIPSDSPWASCRNLYNLYHKAHMPWEWHEELFGYAREIGIIPFSSPFDESAVDLLESLDCPAYKIASPEINHVPLLKRVARTGKPVIISTGVATYDDINLAYEVLKNNNCNDIGILKCTTAYPAPYSDANLKNIVSIKNRFNCIPGLSDHTMGEHGVVCAISLGAKIIEKHFIDDKSIPTADSFFSLDPAEFKILVKKARETEAMLGNFSFDLSDSSVKNQNGKRSLYFSKNSSKGDLISSENIKCVRPGFGLHPRFYDKILGKRLKRNVSIGDRVSLDCFE